ncbi:MAG: hypothetical protein AAGK17_13725 [Pseudomonadota bacterium]
MQAIIFSLMVLIAIATADLAYATTQDVAFGEKTVVKFDIIDARIGSRDRDIRSTTTYTAPTGYVIVDVDMQREGFHSSVASFGMTQPGVISYRAGALGEMTSLVRDGFAKGLFSLADNKATGNIAFDYASFWKQFSAEFRFVADTHASVGFKYTLDSKSGDHGAKLKAHANIILMRVPTEKDIENVVEVLEFVIQQGVHTDITGLIKQVMAE